MLPGDLVQWHTVFVHNDLYRTRYIFFMQFCIHISALDVYKLHSNLQKFIYSFEIPILGISQGNMQFHGLWLAMNKNIWCAGEKQKPAIINTVDETYSYCTKLHTPVYKSVHVYVITAEEVHNWFFFFQCGYTGIL